MKAKVNITDFSGKRISGEQEIPAKDHLEAQRKYRANVFRDKTKYTRKKKHKNRQIDE